MTMEDRVKANLGELMFGLVVQQQQNQDLQNELTAAKAALAEAASKDTKPDAP